MNKKKLMLMGIIALLLVFVVAIAIQPKEDIVEHERESAGITETVQNASTNKEEKAAEESNTHTTKEPDTSVNEDNSNNKNTDVPTVSDSSENEAKPLIPEENVQIGVEKMEHDPDLEGSLTVEESVAPGDSAQNVLPVEPKPTEATSQETLGADFDITKLTYEQYNAMNGTQQKQVIDMFASPEEFMKWYRAVEALYEAEHPDIEIGADGVIDAEDLIQ